MKKSSKHRIGLDLLPSIAHTVSKYVMLLICVAFVLAPFLWIFSTSLKPEREIMSVSPQWIPQNPTLEHYEWVTGIAGLRGEVQTGRTGGLVPYFINSGILSLGSCLFVLLLSIMGGFALSRFRFVGRKSIGIFLLSTTFFPLILMFIPIYTLFQTLGLIDTYFGLIWLITAATVPFCIWMMKSFIDSVPAALEECAMVDGASMIGAFMRVTLPLLAPGMVAVVAYTFMYSWGAYMIPLIFSNSQSTKPISIALAEMLGFYGQTNYGGLMAGAILSSIPIVVVFMFAQRWLIQGMTAGAVKQ